MKVLTVHKLVDLGGVLLRPYIQHVVSDMEAIPLVNLLISQHGAKEVKRHYTMSSFQSYERRYGGQNANGKTIAIYRHYAWGDSLIASAVPRYLKTVYPHVELHFFTHPELFTFWQGNKFIEGEVPIPIPMFLEALKKYDFHIIYEGMLEGNSEPNQGNCYDDMFAFAGLNPPDRFKRPYLFIWGGDYAAMEYLKLDLDCKYLLYQLSPANENRCYPLRLAVKFWEIFLKSFPKWKIIVIGLDPPGQYSGLFKDFPAGRCINLLSKLKHFRHLVPLVEKAGVVVCPDSSIGHLAACFPQVPVVSLWGLFAPADRVKYYPNHYPLWHPEVCPHCPCHNHEFDIPTALCQDAKNFHQVEALSHDPRKPDWCAVLAAISPEEILAGVDRLIHKNFSEMHMDFASDEANAMPLLDEKSRVVPNEHGAVTGTGIKIRRIH